MNIYKRIYEVLINETKIVGKSTLTSTQRTKKAISPKSRRATRRTLVKAGRVHPRNMTANELYTASQQKNRRRSDRDFKPRADGSLRDTDPGMPGYHPYGDLPRWPRGTGYTQHGHD